MLAMLAWLEQVNEVVEATSGAGERQFLVVVHVHSDHAFKKYLETCSATDMVLYRGLLLKVRACCMASQHADVCHYVAGSSAPHMIDNCACTSQQQLRICTHHCCSRCRTMHVWPKRHETYGITSS
jgi:hypothetical protein